MIPVPARAVAPAGLTARARPHFATIAVALAAATRAILFGGVAFALLQALPNRGNAALQTWLARTIGVHGIPAGAESLGWLGALAARAASICSAPSGPAFAAVAYACAALWLVDVRARRIASELGGPQRAAGFAASLALLCTLDALRPGGGASAWCGAALAMLLLDVPSKRNLAAFFAVSVVWCNLAPHGVLAPALALVVAVGATLARPRTGDLRARWLAAALGGLATLCTPAGSGFPAAAFAALRLGDAAAGIVTSVPAVTAPHAYRSGLFVLMLLALVAGARGRGMRDALPVALAFVLALANGAFVPVFGIVAAPVIVAGLRTLRLPAWAPVAFACVAVAAVALVARGAPPPRLASQPFELAAVEAVRARPHALLVCANVDWCDVALAGGERVLVDGRIAPYDADARASQREIAGVGRDWERALARSRATAVLAVNDSPLSTLLGLSTNWVATRRDERATLYERRSQ
ncbi:MAG: hypothetical protein IAI49_00045 [Candidatus Eremiobacteraeota bacterium]|nr:hypothetical protein [Candidatus Eremiobacteraeota bacterium]